MMRAIWIVASMTCVLAGAARADTIAIGSIDGDKSGDLEAIVTGMVESDHAIKKNAKEVGRAMDRLGIDETDNKKSLSKLAAELGVDVVIVGSVEPDGNKQQLRIIVYTVGSQKAMVVKARYARIAELRESSKAKNELLDVIADGRSTSVRSVRRRNKRAIMRDGGEQRDDGPGDEPDDDDDDDDDGGKRGGRGDDDDDDDDDDSDDDDELDNEALLRRRPRHARKAAIRFEAGVSGMSRNLSFNYRDNFTNAQGDNVAPNGYKNPLVAGARFRIELYPMAFANQDSPAAGLGVAAEFDQALGLTTQTSEQEGTKLPTTSRAWSVGARYRIAYGKRLMNPSFTLGVGYGRRAFLVDRSPLMAGITLDIPETDYRIIDAGLGIRIPVHPFAALSVGGRGLFVRQAGPIQTPEEYGRSKVTGVEAEAGIEIQLGKFMLLHFAGNFVQVGFDFEGGATQTNDRDGNPMTQDVGGARDRYFGGVGAVGVIF
jgi:hypothetical protein